MTLASTAADAATGTSSHATASATSRGHEWEKAVIAHWCGVHVLGIDAKHTARTCGPDIVAIIEIVLTVGTTRDAHALAVLLDLLGVPTDPAVPWEAWTGWVSSLSAERPVLVTVTAPTTHREA
ncbi:hypothetical protein ACIGB8_27710 [Promicromonospora sukumoe]|uniref:hypothetical protein n=1 Tax=Promicromonospora sukumoe TaxID=88382 RepID=UPI0037C76BAE